MSGKYIYSMTRRDPQKYIRSVVYPCRPIVQWWLEHQLQQKCLTENWPQGDTRCEHESSARLQDKMRPFKQCTLGYFILKPFIKITEAWLSLCMHLCWTCTAGRPEKRPPECRPSFRQWTFEQQNRHLGSHWEGTTGLWNAQRSFHGTCGWKDLQRKRVGGGGGGTGQLLKCSSSWTQNLKLSHAHPVMCLTKAHVLGYRTFAAAYSHDSLKANLSG